MSAEISLPTVPRVLRTPDERFANLPDFPYAPHYTEVGGLRMANRPGLFCTARSFRCWWPSACA